MTRRPSPARFNIALALIVGCSAAAYAAQAEPNSAGDIPDTQAFVTYRPPGGRYRIDVPEGWARSTHGQDVAFRSKLDAVSIALRHIDGPPPVATLVKEAVASQPHATVLETRRAHLTKGDATLVRFTSRSQPDPVTEKSVELANDAYFFYRDHRLVKVVLSAPVGADNADQWQRVAKSFAWQ
jgi:hypothetical protein